MSERVLIIYGSRFGHSRDVSTHIAKAIHEAQPALQSTIIDVDDAKNSLNGTDLSRYRAVVIAASVQYGHIDKRVERWVKKNLSYVQQIPSLLVTISLSARKFTDDTPAPEEHTYTSKFLDHTGWHPDRIEIAAGRLEYPRYNFFDKTMIRFIMHISGGITDGTSTIEYTNWDRLTDVAEDFVQLVENTNSEN